MIFIMIAIGLVIYGVLNAENSYYSYGYEMSNTTPAPVELLTCEFCYRWLGTYHRNEDCPRDKPTTSKSKDKE